MRGSKETICDCHPVDWVQSLPYWNKQLAGQAVTLVYKSWSSASAVNFLTFQGDFAPSAVENRVIFRTGALDRRPNSITDHQPGTCREIFRISVAAGDKLPINFGDCNRKS